MGGLVEPALPFRPVCEDGPYESDVPLIARRLWQFGQSESMLLIRVA